MAIKYMFNIVMSKVWGSADIYELWLMVNWCEDQFTFKFQFSFKKTIIAMLVACSK